MLKWGLSGRGSNLLKSDRPLMSSTPGWLGVIERRVAFRWLVGCIPRPLASTAEAKACAIEALKLGAVGLRQARTIYGEAQELFIEAERARGLGVKYGRFWMARASLSGPSALL